MIRAERARRLAAEAAQSDVAALVAHLKLPIEKLKRELYGSRSERKARLLEQMELQLEDLETAASEDELAAQKGAVETRSSPAFMRKRPARKPFPEHLPRERVVIAGPKSCPYCGSTRLSRLGEGDPDGAREVRVPSVREVHAAAGAVPRDTARLCRTEPSLYDPLREVRPAPAAEPAE